ncbi:hypothetical protein DY000_02039523 [Brassica cretica]|uniref:Uncharacterized protein n=1 Tax=Brassica cretica TaxID=69181 RepID=A0ABQ7BH25_BRACR|nr:hypothetical protein DY000_02039523 [Brassica cretica]
MIDSSTRTSIDTNPRADMVATLVLQRDENGDLHDPGGHLCNGSGPYSDDGKDPKNSVEDECIPKSETAKVVKKQEALVKGKAVENERHHVNAISDDDFGEVLEQEKLEEDDFAARDPHPPTLARVISSRRSWKKKL